MEIVYYGQSCFKLGGKSIQLVIDPFDPSDLGLKLPKLSADVVMVSHQHKDHNNSAAIGGEPLVIDGPGEYEVKGTSIIGIQADHDNVNGAESGKVTVFTFEVDDVKVCHLSDLYKPLTDSQLETIGPVDILMVPVGGGGFTLDAQKATEVISQLEPKITIPMHYHLSGMKGPKLDDLDKFLKEIGAEPEKTEKLKIVARDLPEEPKVVVFKPAV